MLTQERMIERVRTLCREDSRVRAAMMYGSFALGEGDAYSDIEFILFFQDEALADLDRRAWLEQIAPIELVFVNEYGITAVLFGNLIRGEFHVDPVSQMEALASAWPGAVWFPSLESTLVVDKDGQLAPLLQPLIGEPLRYGRTAAEAQTIIDRFLNWLVFGWSVLQRGEAARALELLSVIQRHLLLMARIVHGSTAHWHIPSRALEQELPAEAYERFRHCTAALDPAALRDAYRAAWAWAREMLPQLEGHPGARVSASLAAKLDAALADDTN